MAGGTGIGCCFGARVGLPAFCTWLKDYICPYKCTTKPDTFMTSVCLALPSKEIDKTVPSQHPAPCRCSLQTALQLVMQSYRLLSVLQASHACNSKTYEASSRLHARLLPRAGTSSLMSNKPAPAEFAIGHCLPTSTPTHVQDMCLCDVLDFKQSFKHKCDCIR